MAEFDHDRDLLRLVNAFKEIKGRGTRRAIVMLVEELAQKQQPAKPIQKNN